MKENEDEKRRIGHKPPSENYEKVYDSLKKRKRIGRGYNWRNTLSEMISISGVLAGFSISFIAFILGGSIADVEIMNNGITFGQTAVLFSGISTSLFICASEFFSTAISFDVFNIPEPYRELLKNDCKRRNEEWADFEDEQMIKCRKNEKWGRICYNIGIIFIFGCLFFVIFPYNFLIAIITTGLGLFLELWQILH